MSICQICGFSPCCCWDLKSRQIGGTHYKKFKIQPVEFCQVNELNFCESNVIKYVARHREKNGVEDLEKAKHYIDMLIEIELERANEKRTNVRQRSNSEGRCNEK